MHIDLFSVFRSTADFNGVLFYYNGALSQNVIATMGEALKQRLNSNTEYDQKSSRKLFSSFIEMLQNAVHYSPVVPGTDEKTGAVAVGNKDGKFFIVCGNLVEKQYVERIRDKIEPLKTMTLDEIKQAYRVQLKNDAHETEDEVSKGAGLGFLTVARDASQPIEYSLVDALDRRGDYAYFYLKAII
jgi:hypothetical protein